MLGCDPKDWRFDSFDSPPLLIWQTSLLWQLEGLIYISFIYLNIFIISWVWPKDLMSRFTSKFNKKAKKFSKAILKDSGQNIQKTNRSLGIFGLYGIFFNLFVITTWYGIIDELNLSQLLLNNTTWYYLFFLNLIFIFVWCIFQEKNSHSSVSSEILGVLSMLYMFFSYYLVVNNIIILIFILECQGILLLYFIVLIQMVGRSTSLGRLWHFLGQSSNKKPLWQVNNLFFQFWSSFLGTVAFLFGSIRLLQIGGLIDWRGQQILGYFQLYLNIFSLNLGWKFLIIFILGGFFLKLGLFPFHFWKPDFYKNFSSWGMFIYTTIYTFALVFLLIIYLWHYWGELAYYWQLIIWYIIIFSFIFIANFLFIITEIRPFLAYMSVFHFIYIVGSLVGDWYKGGFIALFYLMIYVIIMIHFFSILFVVKLKKIIYLTDLQDITRIPIVAGSLICALVAMSGLPPFLGFWGKFLVLFNFFVHKQYFIGIITLAGGMVLLYFYFQNYRFIGIKSSGLMSNPIGLNKINLVIIIYVCLGIIINFIWPFLVVDMYCWNWIAGAWDINF